MEPVELGASVVHGGFPSRSDNGEGIVRAYVDGASICRVLGVECVSEGIQSLFLRCVWLYANWMLDTKLACRLVVEIRGLSVLETGQLHTKHRTRSPTLVFIH
ncbi:hypothetical protein HSR122_1318 [Halapricum desulfuricans]|uniref:Uncharacterized protein n=1 Tax=Halapricum desulfuricans TaxID=2841257 RepID=A0A897NBE2_9EURY|nr:hypothetical protein HSR122_1318 [Halapricum desulfuricans]